MSKTAYEILQNIDELEAQNNNLNELVERVEKQNEAIVNYCLEQLKKAQDMQKNHPAITYEKKLLDENAKKKIELERSLKNISVPWEKAIEIMVDKLNDVEHEIYEVVYSNYRWKKYNEDKSPVEMYAIVLKTEDPLPFLFSEESRKNGIWGNLDTLKNLEGVIILCLQDSECGTIPLKIPKNVVFCDSSNPENVNLGANLTKRYKYLIKEIAKYVSTE